MTATEYQLIFSHMRAHMDDCAHDWQHAMRVTNGALKLAEAYPEADRDIITAAGLLHDIGRAEQFRSGADHALVGAEMALEYLLSIGWSEERARHAAACVRTHRFRSSDPPASVEARLLFDSDKLDVSGAIGMARTFMYTGIVNRPMYTVAENGKITESPSGPPSAVQEYNKKLKNIYGRFCTPEAAAIARGRRRAAEAMYEALIREAEEFLP